MDVTSDIRSKIYQVTGVHRRAARGTRPKIRHDFEIDLGAAGRETTENPQVSEDQHVTRCETLHRARPACRCSFLANVSSIWPADAHLVKPMRIPCPVSANAARSQFSAGYLACLSDLGLRPEGMPRDLTVFSAERGCLTASGMLRQWLQGTCWPGKSGWVRDLSSRHL